MLARIFIQVDERAKALMRRIDRNVKVRPLEDLASLKTVADALAGGKA